VAGVAAHARLAIAFSRSPAEALLDASFHDIANWSRRNAGEDAAEVKAN